MGTLLGRRRRAVVVDAAPLSRELAAVTLRTLGFDAIELADGATALTWLEAAPAPDLVVLARTLRSVTGPDVLRAMRRFARLAAVPAILLVARGESAPAPTCFVRSIERPLRAAALRNAVTAVLAAGEAPSILAPPA